MSTETVSTRTTVYLALHHPIQAHLNWYPADPVAVHLALQVKQTQWVTWRMARQLLTLGLHMPAGDGDVHVEPFLDDDLLVTLHNPHEQTSTAHFLAGKHDVRRFLDRVNTQARLGREQIQVPDTASGLERAA